MNKIFKQIVLIIIGVPILYLINGIMSIKKIHKLVKNINLYKKFCRIVYALNKNFLDKKYQEMFEARFDNKSDSLFEMILYNVSELFIIDHEENEYLEANPGVRNLLFESIMFIGVCLNEFYKGLNKIITWIISLKK